MNDRPMTLPMAGAFSVIDTGRRMPRSLDNMAGPYLDAKEEVTLDFNYDRVLRLEARLGAEFRIPSNTPDHIMERTARDIRGSMMRHIYGPIHQELYKVIDDFYSQGVRRDDPAFKRVADMIDTLGKAFQGDLEGVS